jgi:hypothetical protein
MPDSHRRRSGSVQRLSHDSVSDLRESDALVFIGRSCSSVAEPLYGTRQRKVDNANDHGAEIVLFTHAGTKASLVQTSERAFRNPPDEGDMYKALWKWVRVQRPEVETVYGGYSLVWTAPPRRGLSACARTARRA